MSQQFIEGNINVNLFQGEFYKNAVKFNQELQQKNWKLQNINRFPFTKFIIDGDQFFKTVWKMIDQSKKYFWITTYAMDSSPAADATLIKLTQAVKRGVHVVLFIDNVQYWAKQSLIKQFTASGGTFQVLNPQWKYESIKNYFNQDVWRRHHQKLIVTDNKGLIGSANIQGSYAGIQYGTSVFQDLNYYTQNIILDQYRKHFIDVADLYSFRLEQSKNNNQLLKELNQQFQNSQFYQKDKYRLLHNDQALKKKQIQQEIIQRVKKAQKQIKIIQPYHFPMLKFDKQLIAAHKRGVSAQIITAGKRDQPVFKSIFNYMLFQRLIRNGVTVHETTERMLHSKLYLFDKKHMNIGSMNNDRWSWKINNQVNIAINDPRECEFIQTYYEEILKKTKLVTKNYTISASRAAAILFWQRFLYLSQIVMNPHSKPQEDYVQQEEGHEILELKGNKI